MCCQIWREKRGERACDQIKKNSLEPVSNWDVKIQHRHPPAQLNKQHPFICIVLLKYSRDQCMSLYICTNISLEKGFSYCETRKHERIRMWGCMDVPVYLYTFIHDRTVDIGLIGISFFIILCRCNHNVLKINWKRKTLYYLSMVSFP